MRHVAIIVLTALLAFSPGLATAEVMKQKVLVPGTPITLGGTILYPDLLPDVQAYQKAFVPDKGARIPVNTLVTSAWVGVPRMVTLLGVVKNQGAGKAKAFKAVVNITAGDDALPCTSLPQTLHQTISCPELGPGGICNVIYPYYEGLLPAPKVTKICVTVVADTEPPQGGPNSYPGVVTEKNPNGIGFAEGNNYGHYVFRVKNP